MQLNADVPWITLILCSAPYFMVSFLLWGANFIKYVQRNPEMSSTKSFVGIQSHPNWLNACHLRFASRGGLSYNVGLQNLSQNFLMIPVCQLIAMDSDFQCLLHMMLHAQPTWLWNNLKKKVLQKKIFANPRFANISNLIYCKNFIGSSQSPIWNFCLTK